MAEYKDIVGTTVRVNAGTLSGAKAGELFYDSTNSDFKYRYPNVTSAGAWRTSGALNTTKFRGAGSGTKVAGLAFGGDPVRATTETYNGVSWTEVGDLNTGVNDNAGTGTSTSALSFGGELSPGATGETESWNGSAWTETADLNTVRDFLAGSGESNTASLAFGGETPPPGVTADTELWNGTSWTETTNLNTARYMPGSTGS